MDLDNTLADTRHALTADVRDAVVEVLVAGLPAALKSAYSREKLIDALTVYSPWDLAKRFAISETARDAACDLLDTYAEVLAAQLELFDDARPFLDRAVDQGCRLALVTRGLRRLQEQKIRSLGIASFFDPILVDDVRAPPGGVGKLVLIRSVLSKWATNPPEVLVVGDDPNSEIAAALELGCRAQLIDRDGSIQSKHSSGVRSLAAVDLRK